MKRQIKFRALHEGKMYYSDSQEDSQLLGAKLGESIIGNFMSWFAFNDTLGQFTGINDKKGVSVYEGDIIQLYNHLNELWSKKYWVEFDHSRCAFALKNKDGFSVILSGGFQHQIKVIGNIHQTPELL